MAARRFEIFLLTSRSNGMETFRNSKGKETSERKLEMLVKKLLLNRLSPFLKLSFIENNKMVTDSGRRGRGIN